MFELNGVLIRLSEVIITRYEPPQRLDNMFRADELHQIYIWFKREPGPISVNGTKSDYDRLKEALLKEGAK